MGSSYWPMMMKWEVTVMSSCTYCFIVWSCDAQQTKVTCACAINADIIVDILVVNNSSYFPSKWNRRIPFVSMLALATTGGNLSPATDTPIERWFVFYCFIYFFTTIKVLCSWESFVFSVSTLGYFILTFFFLSYSCVTLSELNYAVNPGDIVVHQLQPCYNTDFEDFFFLNIQESPHLV